MVLVIKFSGLIFFYRQYSVGWPNAKKSINFTTFNAENHFC